MAEAATILHGLLERLRQRPPMDLRQHLRRRWRVYAVLALLGLVQSHYIGLNFTRSTPERVVWLEHGAQPRRGDLMVFRFHAHDGPMATLDGTRWLKRVRGMPGDVVTVRGSDVFVNDGLIGTALARTSQGQHLLPIEPGRIPQGRYFVAGSSADSLDSRYREVGLVRADQLLARAHPLF
jgi:conjugal transfer pilin signal peptidase TrbI